MYGFECGPGLFWQLHGAGKEVVAGLICDVAYGWLTVETLWVNAKQRGQGLAAVCSRAGERLNDVESNSRRVLKEAPVLGGGEYELADRFGRGCGTRPIGRWRLVAGHWLDDLGVEALAPGRRSPVIARATVVGAI